MITIIVVGFLIYLAFRAGQDSTPRFKHSKYLFKCAHCSLEFSADQPTVVHVFGSDHMDKFHPGEKFRA